MITSIKKSDGREIHFSPEKITRAIFLAASRVAQEEGSKADYETAEILTEKVVNLLNNTHTRAQHQPWKMCRMQLLRY